MTHRTTTRVTPLRRPASTRARAARVARIGALLLGGALGACQDQATPDPKLGTLSAGSDTTATAAEIHASITGEKAPGGDAYSFRGLWAGMTQARIDEIIGAPTVVSDTSVCQPVPKTPDALLCGHDATLGEDRAHVHVAVLYGPAVRGVRTAREVTVVRQLPLDVDGVRVAAALADAFEKQTTLLDSRDASYGRHQAHIRMGTVNGARANFAEVTVAAHSGREELTVRMGRGAAR